MSNGPILCGKIIGKNEDKRLGGPRYICMLQKGHQGQCSKPKLVSQYEHGQILSGFYKEQEHEF